LTPRLLKKLSSIITDGADFTQHALSILPEVPANKLHIVLCWVHHEWYKEWSHQIFSPPPMTEDVSDDITRERLSGSKNLMHCISGWLLNKVCQTKMWGLSPTIKSEFAEYNALSISKAASAEMPSKEID
jgi:hypothetical protein